MAVYFIQVEADDVEEDAEDDGKEPMYCAEHMRHSWTDNSMLSRVIYLVRIMFSTTGRAPLAGDWIIPCFCFPFMLQCQRGHLMGRRQVRSKKLRIPLSPSAPAMPVEPAADMFGKEGSTVQVVCNHFVLRIEVGMQAKKIT